MSELKVSSRYAKALLEIAEKDNLTDQVKEDFVKIQELIKSSRDIRNLIKSPVIQYWKKMKVIEEVFKPVISTLSLHFLMLLAEKRREVLIPSIVEQFHIQYNENHGILPVDVISAIEMDGNLKDNIRTKLEDRTHKKVIADFKVDPSIKGGLKLKIEDWVYDSSVERQLHMIGERLSKGLSVNEE